MVEEATSSTQLANPVQDTNVHLTGIDYEKSKHAADQHWLVIGAEQIQVSLASVERAVSDGILFKVGVSIAGRQRIGIN